MTSRLLYSFNDSKVSLIQSSTFEVCPSQVSAHILSWKGLLTFSNENPAIMILPLPKNNDKGRRFAEDIRDLVIDRVLKNEFNKVASCGGSDSTGNSEHRTGGSDSTGDSGSSSRFFTRGDFGKPQIEGLCFNISYTQGWFALALSRSMPIGIDIESKAQLEERYKKNPRGLQAVVQHFFSVQETLTLECISSEKDWIREFGRMWCYKEAVVKCRGLSFGSHGVLVSAFNYPRITTILENEGPEAHSGGTEVHSGGAVAYSGGPEAHSRGTEVHSRGTEAHSGGTEVHSRGTEAQSGGPEARAKGPDTPNPPGVEVQEIEHPDVYCFFAKG